MKYVNYLQHSKPNEFNMDHPQYHLLRFLQTFDDLSEREAIELSKQFIQMNLDTNEVFIAQNSIVEHVGYVVEGALCAFFINSEGEKENSYILSEGHFFLKLKGFTTICQQSIVGKIWMQHTQTRIMQNLFTMQVFLAILTIAMREAIPQGLRWEMQNMR